MSTEDAVVNEPSMAAVTTRPAYNHFAPRDRPQSWFHDEWEARREECPVSYSPEHGGFYLLTRYEDVYEVLGDTATFTSTESTALPPPPFKFIPEDLDPPQHRKYRNLVSNAFAPQRMPDYEPWVRQLAVDLLQPLVGRKQFDVVHAFASPFPRSVAVRLIGIPENDLPLIAQWTEVITYTPEGEEVQAAGVELFGYLEALIVERMSQPLRNDLVGMIVNGQVDGHPLSANEAVSFIALLLFGGLHTTTHAIAGTLVWLAQHPGDRRLLRSDPSRLPVALEEALRYTSPATHVVRTTTKNVEVSGCPIPAGSRVMVGLGAANFDPHRFDEPRTMKFDRPRNAHAAFGFGPHRCVGSHLAKLQLRIAIEEFLVRFPDFELPDPGALRYEGAEVRGLITVPLAIRRGSPGVSVDSR
jgi:cytochrome P450